MTSCGAHFIFYGKTESSVTCVEASSQRGPRLVVLPQVPQVPVALVLHQAYHLFVCENISDGVRKMDDWIGSGPAGK